MIGIDLKSVFKSRKQATLIETNNRTANKNKSLSKKRNYCDSINTSLTKRKYTYGIGSDTRLSNNNDYNIQQYQPSVESKPYKQFEFYNLSTQQKSFEIIPKEKKKIDPHSEEFLLKTISVLKEYILSQQQVHVKEISELKSQISKLKIESKENEAKAITLLKENSNLKSKTLDIILNIRTYEAENITSEHEYRVSFNFIYRNSFIEY